MKTLFLTILSIYIIIPKDKTNIHHPYDQNKNFNSKTTIETSILHKNIKYLDTLINLTYLKYKKIDLEDLKKCFAITWANLKFSLLEQKWLSANFVFSQAILETGFGRAGRNHKTNLFALYETDKGTKKVFKNYIESTEEYFYIIHNKYKKCKSEHHLLLNFTNCYNLRYASSTKYEELLKKIYTKNQHKLKNIKSLVNQQIIQSFLYYMQENNKYNELLQIIFLHNTFEKIFIQRNNH